MAAAFKRLQRFFHELRVEIKKVNWPTRQELSLYTGIVLAVIIVLSTFFWVLDTGFTEALRLVIQ